MTSYIYCADYTNKVLRKYLTNGTLKWSFSVNQVNRWGVEVDASGNIYYGTDDGIIRKLSPSGVQLWSASLVSGGIVWRLTVDDIGSVFVTQNNGTTTKLTSSGTIVWTFTYSPIRTGSALAIDANKDIYIASRNGDSNDVIIKLIQNSTGTAVSLGWTISNIDNCEFLAVNPTSEYVYAVSKGTTRFVKKINTFNGSVIWSVVPNSNSLIYGVAVGLDEFVYISGSLGILWKLNPVNGAVVWSLQVEAEFLLGVSLDLMGNICLAGRNGAYVVRESSDGLSAQLIRTIAGVQSLHITANDPGVFSRTFRSLPSKMISFSLLNRRLGQSYNARLSNSSLYSKFPFIKAATGLSELRGTTRFQSGAIEFIGVDGTPYTAFVDFDNDGGYWVLVAKFGSHDKTLNNVFSQRTLDTADADSLSFADFGAKTLYARLSRTNMNALWQRSDYVTRIHHASSSYPLVSGVYFQRKITNASTFDFWSGLYNSALWADGSTVNQIGSMMADYGGQRWDATFAWANTNPTLSNYTTLTGGGTSYYNALTNELTFNGVKIQSTDTNGYRMGAWDYPVTFTAPANENSITVTRHMGFFADITSGSQWLLTSNINDYRYPTNEEKQSLIFLKLKKFSGVAAPFAARTIDDLIATGSTTNGVYWLKPDGVVNPYKMYVNFTTKTQTAFEFNNGTSELLAAPSIRYLRSFGITTSGVYWLKPDGYGGQAFKTYIDFDTDGGGWVLVAKFGGYNKTIDKLFNTNAFDTGVDSLSTADFGGYSTFARLSMSQMNFLWKASCGVTRIHFKNDASTTSSGVYFQRKITNTETFDFWTGLYNTTLWADGDSVTPSYTRYGGIRWQTSFAWANTIPTLSTYKTTIGTSTFYNTTSHAVQFNGTPSYPDGVVANGYGMGAWDFPVNVSAPPNSTPIVVTRHCGFFADINMGNQWLCTSNPNESRFAANEPRESLVFLRCL